MLQQSLLSSLLAMSLAAKYASREKSDRTMIVLTSAKAALDPTPGMISYGCAKSGVLNLVRSAAADGRYANTCCFVAILPYVVLLYMIYV